MKRKKNKLSAEIRDGYTDSDKVRKDDNESAEKKRVDLSIEAELPVNEYYYKVAGRYRFAMFMFGFLFIAYLLLVIILFKSELTYDNLMYAVRDINTNVSTPSMGFDGLKLDEESKMSFGLYRERLALGTNSGFTLYNTAGSKELHYSYYMENPKVLTSDKYTLVYDMGKTDYRIYNTLTKVLDRKHDYKIQGAAVSKSGAYALISRSDENKYVVRFYDENFVNIYNSYKDNYVMDAALDSTGKKYVILSTDISGVDFVTEIQIGKTDSEESVSVKAEGYMPLKAFFFDDGSVCAVCDKGLIFCNRKGEIVTKQTFTEFSLKYSYAEENRIMIAGTTDTVGKENKTVIYDSGGAEVLTLEFEGKMTTAALGRKYAFYATGEEIVRVSFDGVKESENTNITAKQLIPEGDSVVVCGASEVFSAFDLTVKNDTDGSAENSEIVEISVN